MIHRCILIRHAVTSGGEEGRYMGLRTDEPLSDRGRLDAYGKKEYIQHVAGDRFMLYASPLLRTYETAQILFGTDKIKVADDLKEIDFGSMDGRTHAELDGDPDYQEWIDSRGYTAVPDAERMDDFVTRSMRGFIYALTDTPAGMDTVIVCHGGSIMAILSTLTDGDFYDYMCGYLDGYVMELDIDDGEIDLLSYERVGSRHPA